MSDAARRAGVHAATVSRALRNDPRITPAQRHKIQRVAADLCYRQNPPVAALMTARRAGRLPAHDSTLAFVTRYPADRAAFFRSEFGHLLAGAQARAQAQGFRIDEFNVDDPALSPSRVTEVADGSSRRLTDIRRLNETNAELCPSSSEKVDRRYEGLVR